MKRPFFRKKASPPQDEAHDQAHDQADARPGLPLPSTDPATNFLIADIVLRAAGDLAREAVEKKTLTQTYDRAKAEELVSSQSIAKTIALYGISRIATRSPAGLALVAGGLVLKALYDRGKSIEARGSKAFPRLKLPGTRTKN